jgi:hypothetical protein
MKLVHTIPKLGALPELLIFCCPLCNGVDTIESDSEAGAQGPFSWWHRLAG